MQAKRQLSFPVPFCTLSWEARARASGCGDVVIGYTSQEKGRVCSQRVGKNFGAPLLYR